jgi:putative transcriptional regulator
LKKAELSRKIGNRIVQLREKKGWTQSDLARALLKDRQTIHKIETGDANPTVHTLHEIAKVLEVALMEIFRF